MKMIFMFHVIHNANVRMTKFSTFFFCAYSGKFRKPAWTDRVLWKEKQEKMNTVQLITYKSHDQYMTSDHRPVSALLNIDMQVGEGKNISKIYGS